MMRDSMLKEINFDNYRCFNKSKLSFKDLSIIVGKNNSGKSTIVEALRLISAASKKSKKAIYTTPAPSLGLPLANKGFKIDVQKLKIDLRGIRYFYNEDKNATINAIYSNGTKIVVYLNSEVAFACIYDDTGSLITRKKKAEEYEFDKIDILPQIGLIKENEPMLSKETIVTDKNTYLSSRHFRNELLINKEEYFSDFCEIVEATWSGLRIRDLCY